MKHILSLFMLRDLEKEIFEIVYYNGPISAARVAKSAGISRTSVYDLLEKLVQGGLLIESQKSGVKLFSSQSLENLYSLVTDKEQQIKRAKEEIDRLKREQTKEKKVMTPRLQLFEGKKELQQMMKEILFYDNLTVQAYWPLENMIETLSPEFYQEFDRKRLNNNISLKVLWPQNHAHAAKKHAYLNSSPQSKREVRILPSGVNFSLGYAIYGNNVRFLSSKKENFGFIIESSELAEMLRGQFDIIWKISKDYKSKKYYRNGINSSSY